MRRHAVVLALVLALSAFGGSAVEGSPITYDFSGTVAYAFGSLSLLAGTPIYGQLLYDPAWPTHDGLKSQHSSRRVLADHGQREIGVYAVVSGHGPTNAGKLLTGNELRRKSRPRRYRAEPGVAAVADSA